MISVKFVDKSDVPLTRVPVRMPAIPQLGNALSLNDKLYVVMGSRWSIDTNPDNPVDTVTVTIALDPL